MANEKDENKSNEEASGSQPKPENDTAQATKDSENSETESIADGGSDAQGSEGDGEEARDDSQDYTFDDIVDMAGYGKFQKILTCLAGLSWVIFFGMIAGAPFFGMVADYWGRRMAIGVSTVALFIFGALSALSVNMNMMFATRTFMGFALGGVAQAVTLCSEFYPAKSRGIAGFYLSWYPESVRYYLVSNQYDKAVAQLELMAQTNGMELPPGNLIKTQQHEGRANILDLLKQPLTRTTLLFWFIWFSVAFHYYALALFFPIIIEHGKLPITNKEIQDAANITSTDPNDFFMADLPCNLWNNEKFLTLLWTSSSEFPGLFIYTILVNYMSRKLLLSCASVLNAGLIFLLLLNVDSAAFSYIILCTARANVTGMFQLVFIMTSEAFPTTLRSTGMGSGSAMARIGGTVVPFAAQVLIVSSPVGAICLIGSIILLGGLAVVFLPHETKDVHMKDWVGQYDTPKNVLQDEEV